MKKIFVVLFVFLIVLSCSKEEVQEIGSPAISPCYKYLVPPFWGTIVIDPDIITPDDPTTFVSLTYAGTGVREMHDRRFGDVILEPYLFLAEYDDGLTIEIQVNPEFGTKDNAEFYALKYAEVIGRLPTGLRIDVETSWIHKGEELFGGGDNNLLIHTDYSEIIYEEQGILEEVLIHEAAHVSLDTYHAESAGWLEAQSKDCDFISLYAKDYPMREDLAESYLPYFALRYRPDRISEFLKRQIEHFIPNRIEYFDELSIDMYPIEN
jgi:hypothetical protein